MRGLTGARCCRRSWPARRRRKAPNMHASPPAASFQNEWSARHIDLWNLWFVVIALPPLLAAKARSSPGARSSWQARAAAHAASDAPACSC